MSTKINNKFNYNAFCTRLITGAFLTFFLLTGLYFITNVNQSNVSAYPGNYFAGYHKASTRHTYNNYYPANVAMTDLKNAYIEHLETQFRLYTKEEHGQLKIKIAAPLDFQYKTTSRGWEFSISEIRYNTVANPLDCQKNLFANNYSHGITELNSFTSLPLVSSDYSRYFCFMIRLKVNKPGWDFRPAKTFAVNQPISTTSTDRHLSNPEGFSQAIMQSTYYNYKVGLIGNNNHSEKRDAYYNHLNEHFNLYAKPFISRVDLQITLPPAFEMTGSPDIRSFNLKKIEYALVNGRDDCNRNLFKGSTNRVSHPELTMSLPQSTQGYCFKVSVKGEKRFTKDVNPYKIFFIAPQAIR